MGAVSQRKIRMEPWYSEGLRFKCTGCGKCCTGSGGYVFLTPKDLEQLANHLSISPETFRSKYTQKVDDRLALIDKPHTDECIFLENQKCTVYDARPSQCRTFPWWIYNLRSPKSWQDAASRCEGINHKDAPLIPLPKIEEQKMTYLDHLLEQNFSN